MKKDTIINMLKKLRALQLDGTLPQLIIVIHALRSEEDTTDSIVERTGYSTSLVSKTMSKFDDLFTLHMDPNDRRLRTIYLTTRGRHVAEELGVI